MMTEVGLFRAWADAYPHTGRNGEWECDYKRWPALWEAVLAFVANRPFNSWTETELQAVLYAIARDNEFQYLADEILEHHAELIPLLARAALRVGEWEARWQLTMELGQLGSANEPLLLEMARDEHEYVRRQALRSLLMIGSPAVEELALAAWHRPDQDQEYSRMMALYCLYKLGSPQLEPLLAVAEQDTRQYVRGYAERIRRGETLE
jgi:HEAT repeat protein